MKYLFSKCGWSVGISITYDWWPFESPFLNLHSQLLIQFFISGLLTALMFLFQNITMLRGVFFNLVFELLVILCRALGRSGNSAIKLTAAVSNVQNCRLFSDVSTYSLAVFKFSKGFWIKSSECFKSCQRHKPVISWDWEVLMLLPQLGAFADLMVCLLLTIPFSLV